MMVAPSYLVQWVTAGVTRTCVALSTLVQHRGVARCIQIEESVDKLVVPAAGRCLVPCLQITQLRGLRCCSLVSCGWPIPTHIGCRMLQAHRLAPCPPTTCLTSLQPTSLRACQAPILSCTASSTSCAFSCQTSSPRQCWTLGLGQGQPSGPLERYASWGLEGRGVLASLGQPVDTAASLCTISYEVHKIKGWHRLTSIACLLYRHTPMVECSS